MTDGGTRMETSEAKRDIKRVRQVREENAEQTEEPELHRCPTDGCNRTTIDNPSGLRSHVRQAGDDAHRFRTLNEDLGIEVDEEQYHSEWYSGYATGSEPTETTINSVAVVDWEHEHSESPIAPHRLSEAIE